MIEVILQKLYVMQHNITTGAVAPQKTLKRAPEFGKKHTKFGPKKKKISKSENYKISQIR